MLDSANDTIDQLKAELADMQGELEDARRMAEDMESQIRAVHEQDGTEKSNLRQGDRSLQTLSVSFSSRSELLYASSALSSWQI